MRRDDFPQLNNGYIYLDNAATTLKPKRVISALTSFYTEDNANIKRGLYKLSVNTTEQYENARETVANFINADRNEIVFTHGTTESLNMIARGLKLQASDKIVISITEHHSNMLPWRNTSAEIQYLYCDKNGYFSDESISNTINEGVKIVAISAYSNILGENYQLEKIIKRAHEIGALVVVDAAQAIAHMQIDVQKLDIDFMAFSGHKIYAPMGIGVLYGKRSLLEELNPLIVGGEMVDYVTVTDAKLTAVPDRLEAGTMNVAGAIGLAEAMKYLDECNFDELLDYERKLSTYAFNKLSKIPYLELAGAARSLNMWSSIFCFNLKDVHSHDISALLDSDNLCLRAGFHCAQPLVDYLEKGPLVRLSLCFYNNFEEIDKLTDSLSTIRKRMGING